MQNAKNVLLVTIECLRADHLHFLGYPQPITPTLDMVARNGLTFSNAMVTFPWTPASFKSMLTSRYPLMDDGVISIPAGVDTLPSVLREHGYRTGAVVPKGWLSRVFNYHRGFDSFQSGVQRSNDFSKAEDVVKRIFDQQRKTPTQGTPANQGTFREYIRHGKDFFKQVYPPYAKYFTGQATSWLRQNHEEPFFFLLHYRDPHEPYYPGVKPALKYGFDMLRGNMQSMKNHATRKPGDITLTNQTLQMLIALYNEEIRIVDRAIRTLVQTLLDLGLLNDTYIILAGDHGQQFMEHGEYGHGLHLYKEVLNVPLVIWGPNIKKETVATPVSLLHLPSTVLDLLGYDPDRFRGCSLLHQEKREERAKAGIITEEARETRNDYVIGEGTVQCDTATKKIAVTTPKWKYIYKTNEEDELYQLQNDPQEHTNLYHTHPPVLPQLQKTVQNHIHTLETSKQKNMIKARIQNIKKKLA